MGMFDKFIPQPDVRCPKCAGIISGWQGKPESGSALFIWKQGVKEPIDQDCDEQCKASQEILDNIHLPKTFSIWGGECTNCGFELSYSEYSFYGETENNVWVKTSFTPYYFARNQGENWFKCPKCLNIWETNIEKTHDYCPSCNVFVELRNVC